MQLHEVPRYYDRAAAKYDRRLAFWFGRVLRIEGWRQRAVDALGDLNGATVLDVGCGTGANFELLARRVGRGGRILGVDYSPGMLARARQRIERNGWTHVELRRGDAATLDVVTEQVDAALSTYCLGIVHDLDGAVRAITERVRPGGRLAIVDFERVRPPHGPLRGLFPLYRRILLAYSIDSPEDLDDDALRARWERALAFLGDHFDEATDERFFFDMGLFFAGTRH